MNVVQENVQRPFFGNKVPSALNLAILYVYAANRHLNHIRV
jgi:hypothetical protein